MTSSTPPEATARLDATARRVRTGGGARTGAWLTGMAVATFAYLSALGIAGPADGEVSVVSVVFGITVAALSFGLLPGGRVARAGFERRWVAAVVSWGVLFAAAMVVGMLLLREVLAFWPVAGAVAALPLVLGARAELRS